MRDGVNLSATVYRDPRQTAPLPVIVTMTPYIAAHAARQGVYFAQNGYVFVAVDSRGRGNSAGTFVPGQVEGRDGYDLVEWAAKQPWSNGAVAMWGGSWLGFTQWATAKEMPPHLKAIAPTASVHPGVDYPQPNGIFVSYALRWLQFVQGHALNEGIFESTGLWRNALRQLVAQKGAFKDYETVSGAIGTVFGTWIRHPREDAFWQAMTPQPADYAKLRIPILTVTGHYDADQRGAMAYYTRHMASGAKDVIARHSLVIGPWNHSGTRRPTPEMGGVSFGPGAVVDMEALHKAWYDHVLKGGPRPELLSDRVSCFVMGTNTWIHAPDLEHLEKTPMRFELDVAGAVAGDIGRTGRLTGKAKAAGAVVLTSDPLHVPTDEELESEDEAWLRDQRQAYATEPSHVVLQTAPFTAATVVSGRPQVRLQLSSDQPDADVWVDLYEVLPDGSAVYLTGTSLRLRYRGGGIAGVPMVPNKIERVELPRMTFFARSIAKGSRLRMVIDAGPVWGAQFNNHTGGDAASEPLSAARVGKLTIYSGPGRDTSLELTRPDEALLVPAVGAP